MSKKKNQNKFFFISFIPALAYWYLEENYSLKIALIGGMSLGIIELTLEYIFFKHLHLISKLNFALIAFLGAISLLGDDGIWFKLQPMFTGLAMGGFLLYRSLIHKSLMWDMVEEFNENPPPKIFVTTIERHMSILLIIYGVFMGAIALYFATDYWLFFKTIGFYLVFGVFMVSELIFFRFFFKPKG